MKKLFLLTFFVMFLVSGMTSFAQKYEVEFEALPQKIVIAEYSDNLISDVKVIRLKDGDKTAEFETIAEKFSVYSVFEDKIESVIPNKVAEENEVSDNKKDYPDVYEKEKYANRAIMLVTSVSGVYENNDKFIAVDVMFHGEERTLKISEDVLISKVPEGYQNIYNKPVSSLKKGDIINISVMFNNVIDEVFLIFRPTTKNPVLSDDWGMGFNKLFSDNGIVIGQADYKAITPQTGVTSGYGYAFGIVSDRQGSELELRYKNGEALLVDIADGAIVYEVDMEEKLKASKGTASALRRTGGVKKAFNEEGEFLGWDENEKYNYVFLRTIDKYATEVVLYKNY